MTILYCDCFSGISGDMFLGALLDAGLPMEHLSEQFKLLNLPEYRSVQVNKIKKGALAATLMAFDIEEHTHDHHGHHCHHHPVHRHFHDIMHMIWESELAQPVKELAMAIFHKLAMAEARVHGTSIDEVHFHEVGAVDSILDIVGAAVGLHYFGIDDVYASALPLGSGSIHTEHGLLPLPAPATMELMRMMNAPVVPSPAAVELVTPTGAAILAACATFAQPGMSIHHVGIGAGQRDLEWPNVLRILIGSTKNEIETHVELETNIDDMNPQILGHAMETLFKAGALDVFFTPIYMKKNRPGAKLSVIARKIDESKLAEIMLRETSTLGVRVHPVHRHEADREMRSIETRFGMIPVKVKRMDGQVTQAVPEFDVCVKLAEEAGVPVADVLQAAAGVLAGRHDIT